MLRCVCREHAAPDPEKTVRVGPDPHVAVPVRVGGSHPEIPGAVGQRVVSKAGSRALRVEMEEPVQVRAHPVSVRLVLGHDQGLRHIVTPRDSPGHPGHAIVPTEPEAAGPILQEHVHGAADRRGPPPGRGGGAILEGDEPPAPDVDPEHPACVLHHADHLGEWHPVDLPECLEPALRKPGQATPHRPDPDHAVPGHVQCRDLVVGETVRDRVLVETGALPAQQPAFRPDPERAVGTLRERQDPIDVTTGAVASIDQTEGGAIEPRQSAERAHPQIAVAGLDDRVHGVLRQAVRGGPLIDGVFGRGRERTSLLRQERGLERQHECSRNPRGKDSWVNAIVDDGTSFPSGPGSTRRGRG